MTLVLPGLPARRRALDDAKSDMTSGFGVAMAVLGGTGFAVMALVYVASEALANALVGFINEVAFQVALVNAISLPK
jgi:hypothetical protein